MAGSSDGKAGRGHAPATSEVALTRRLMLGFLLSAGGAGTAAAQTVGKMTTVPPVSLQGKTAVELGQAARNPNLLVPVIPDVTSFKLIRPEDMLILDFAFENMVVSGAGKQRQIKRVDAARPAYMRVRFQPQAIAEQVFPDLPPQGQAVPKMPDLDHLGKPTNSPPASGGKIQAGVFPQARMAHQSDLAFVMPGGVNAIDFTTPAVLDACRTWPLSLDTRAVDAPTSQLEAHDFDQTRQRMTVLVQAQKADLKAYKGGRGAIEAMLRRAADEVADSLAQATADGSQLEEAQIQALIDAVVTRELAVLLPPKGSPLPKGAQATSGKVHMANNYKAIVDAQATAKLVDLAAQKQQVFTGGGLFKTFPPQKTRLVTNIEAPYRLHISPLATAGFTHATGFVNHGTGFAELWHTRLGTRVDDWVIDDRPEPIRALYSEDPPIGQQGAPKNPGDTTDPVLTGDWTLSSIDHADLVTLTTQVQPAMARRLHLTALGASFEFDGQWNNPSAVGADILAWNHVAAIGRDQYVRVVYDGFLFPFGHRASLIKVSERKFSRQADGGRVAAIMQKHYIVVREKTRAYPALNQPNQGRDVPFLSVDLLTHQTPDLATPKRIDDPAIPAGFYDTADSDYQAFWPALMTGGDMVFHLAGVDAAGKRTPFAMPLMFVAATRNDMPKVKPDPEPKTGPKDHVGQLVAYYNGSAEARRGAYLPRNVIRFCDPARDVLPQAPSETDYTVTYFAFNALQAKVSGPDANFFPGLDHAQIEIPSYKHLLGKTVTGYVTYHSDYAAHGFDPAKNRGEMLLALAGVQPLDVGTTDRFGGLIKPVMTPKALSRLFGGVSDMAAYSGQAFDPVAALKGTNLLGFIPLDEIFQIKGETTDLINGFDQIPKAVSADLGNVISTSYTLNRDKVHDYGTLFQSRSGEITDGSPQLSIVATVTTPKDGSPPDAKVQATLLKFTVNLFGYLALNFDKLALKVEPGHKTDVDPKLDPKTGVVFGGPLEFVNQLRQFIPGNGFSDPPGLDVTPDGISASYTLTLPPIAVGALSLQNISLGAGFNLPFTGGGPSASFHFAEQHNPFNLTVALFGGGGFCAIEVGTEGVIMLNTALEFGAQISIDLGVASGGVYVKGGFHFSWDQSKSQILLEAYVEMGGHLDVLGLVNVSLVFHLALSYEKTGDATRLYGTATLTVEIDIAFFSCSQDVTVERQFAGSNSDPSVAAFLPEQSVWDAYCDAFAA